MRSGIREIQFTVNGERKKLLLGYDIQPSDTLAKVIRENLGLFGTKLSCEEGVCGACTVLFNGEAVLSCHMLAADADGGEVITVEGLPEDDPVILAFANECDENYGVALQCGFCTPGFIMETHALLRKNPNPSKEEIVDGLSGHICRCGCYQGIEHAVEKAAAAVRKINGITRGVAK